jgi:hypothetical protein
VRERGYRPKDNNKVYALDRPDTKSKAQKQNGREESIQKETKTKQNEAEDHTSIPPHLVSVVLFQKPPKTGTRRVRALDVSRTHPPALRYTTPPPRPMPPFPQKPQAGTLMNNPCLSLWFAVATGNPARVGLGPFNWPWICSCLGRPQHRLRLGLGAVLHHKHIPKKTWMNPSECRPINQSINPRIHKHTTAHTHTFVLEPIDPPKAPTDSTHHFSLHSGRHSVRDFCASPLGFVQKYMQLDRHFWEGLHWIGGAGLTLR